MFVERTHEQQASPDNHTFAGLGFRFHRDDLPARSSLDLVMEPDRAGLIVDFRKSFLQIGARATLQIYNVLSDPSNQPPGGTVGVIEKPTGEGKRIIRTATFRC